MMSLREKGKSLSTGIFTFIPDTSEIKTLQYLKSGVTSVTQRSSETQSRLDSPKEILF